MAHAHDVADVKAPIWLTRRADANHRQIGLHDRLGRVGYGLQAAGRDHLFHHLAEVFLDHRGLAVVDQLDLGRVRIDADDGVAVRGEAGGRYAADIAKPKDTDTHGSVRLWLRAGTGAGGATATR